MGRAARAGVRVGLFVCSCLCRERPPCEGFIPSVTAEGSEGFLECVLCAPRGVMAKGACPREFPHLSGKTVKPEESRFPPPPFEPTNQPGSVVVGG